MRETDVFDLAESISGLRQQTVMVGDPMTAEVGYHITDDPYSSSYKFQWFESIEEMVDYLIDVQIPELEARAYMTPEAATIVRHLLCHVRQHGLSTEAQDMINKGAGGLTIHWWGTLDELLSGMTLFSRELLGLFAVSRGDGRGVSVRELPGFLEFLQTRFRSYLPAYDGLLRGLLE